MYKTLCHTFPTCLPILSRDTLDTMKTNTDGNEFLGSTTVGAKGQTVIPAEARKAMNLKEGDKLLVFRIGCDMVAFSKLSQMERFVTHLSKKLTTVKSAIKKAQH